MSVVRPVIVVPASTTPEMAEVRSRLAGLAGLTNQAALADVLLVRSVAVAPSRVTMDLFVRSLVMSALVVPRWLASMALA